VKRVLLVSLFVPSLLLAQREPGGKGPRREGLFGDSAGPPAKRAYSIGVIGYTGGQWQPSGIEFSLLWKLGQRSQTVAGAWVSLGSFTQNNAVYLGTTRGFYTALGVTLRQPLLTLVEIGSERSPGYVRIEANADFGWSADFNSPLPQGKSDGRAALLGGIAFGSADPLGQSFSLLFGSAALFFSHWREN
jgi:hypothetical protein